MAIGLVALVVVLFLVVLFLLSAIKVAREHERGIVFRLGRLFPEPTGPGAVHPDPDRRPDGEGRPAHGHAEHPAAGSDHEGQRAGAGERGRLLSDRRAESELLLAATGALAEHSSAYGLGGGRRAHIL